MFPHRAWQVKPHATARAGRIGPISRRVGLAPCRKMSGASSSREEVTSLRCSIGWTGRIRMVMTRGRVLTVLLVVALFGSISARLSAQAVIRQQPAQRRVPAQPPKPAFPSGPMLIETSAPILNLLGRAEEGIARLDWKLAIDSLQRVIEDPEGALVERDDSESGSTPLYESARRQATRRLATLPPEGLEAYRILYDGKAKGMLDRARAAHLSDTLRELVERFLLTSFGDDASDLLASWELDIGRPGRALALLIDLRELVPDSDVPVELVNAKLVAAYSLLGQTEQAKDVLQPALVEGVTARRNPGWFQSLSSLSPRGVPSSPSGVGWSEIASLASSYSIMPDIEPSLAVEPARFALSGTSSNWWEWLSEDAAAARLHLPSARFVTDERRLFVRKPGGCAALDADDLSVIWDSTASPGGGVQRRVRSYGAAAAAAGGGRTDDEIGQAITIAHDLVMFIERGGAANTIDAIRAQQLQPNAPVRPGATRLIARRADTGEVAWERSAGGDPSGALNGAMFRHPPIGVADELWMPYYKQSDLFFAILEPRTGALKRSVLLGSARETIDPLGPAMPPVYADGVVFLPSGGSTLFAVDAYDHTVRWARQYDRNSRGRPDATVSARGWRSTEPIVRGGNVLLAAADQADLLAFSAISGDTRWAAAVEGAAYVIAGDSEHVWVGGQSISCVSVVTGEQLWSTRLVKPPSGQAALCGDRVLVPTVAGMLLLDSGNGQSLGLEAPPGEGTPLGNLACSDTALYSVEFDAVRKFSDIERTYALAAKRNQARPDEAEAALRLASAEFLKGEAARAWEIASAMAPTAFRADAHRRAMLAGLKVSAALHLARSSLPGSAASLARLEDARDAAVSGADRLRCAFAMADHHAAASEPEKAYEILWTLGTREESSTPLRLTDGVNVAARLEIARRLAQVVGSVPPALKPKLGQKAEAAFRDIVARLARPEIARAAIKQLVSLGQLERLGGVGSRALLAAAQWERKRQAFERSELLLDEIPGKGCDPLLAASAMVERCSLYDPTGLNWAAGLEPCLRELEMRYGAVTLPTVPEVTPRVPAGRPVSDWIARLRPAPAASPPQGPHGEAPPSSVALTLEPAWTHVTLENTPVAPAGRVVQFEPATAPVLQDRIVTFRQDGALDCIDSVSGDILWHTELRLPGDFPEPFLNNRPDPNAVEQHRRAAVDGQVAVFNHDDGLYAVGLLTGRRLWAHPFELVDLAGRAYLRDAAMAVGDGVLAAMPHDGRLALLRMLDGSMLWERDLRGESVHRIWMDGDRILTSNGPGERIHIFDRADGRLVQQVLFDQPEGSAAMIRLVRTPGLVIGPQVVQLGSSVVAVSTDTGETAWKVDLELPLLQLFKPAEGFVGLGMGQGVVRVLDAKTGELVLERTVPGGLTVSAGVLVDANFIVRTDGVRQQRQSVELSAFDVATGENVWQRSDIGSIVSNDEPLPVFGGVIPVMVEALQTNVSPSGAATPSYRASMALIDVRTGQNAGLAADLSMVTSGSRFTGDVVLKGGALIVGSNRGVMAFRTKPVTRAEGGKDF